jgi:hypothetical protein
LGVDWIGAAGGKALAAVFVVATGPGSPVVLAVDVPISAVFVVSVEAVSIAAVSVDCCLAAPAVSGTTAGLFGCWNEGTAWFCAFGSSA